MDSRARCDVGREQVPHRPIGEKAPDHNFPIAPPRREDVQVVAVFASLDEISSRFAVLRDLAGRRDMVSGDVIANNQNRVGAVTTEA